MAWQARLLLQVAQLMCQGIRQQPIAKSRVPEARELTSGCCLAQRGETVRLLGEKHMPSCRNVTALTIKGEGRGGRGERNKGKRMTRRLVGVCIL